MNDTKLWTSENAQFKGVSQSLVLWEKKLTKEKKVM